MRQLQSFFFSWYLFTNIQLVATATISKPHNPILLPRDFKDKYDNAYFIGQGQWACSPTALSALKGAFADVQRLAQAAIDVLQVSGSETSDAFETWFGDSNATPQKVTEILNEHFKPAMTHFLFPSRITAIAFNGDEIIYKGFPNDPLPSVDSIVYACPPITSAPVEICKPSSYAAVVSPSFQKPDGSTEPAGATILALCPKFFESTTTIDQMVQAWKSGLTLMEPTSRDIVLLHELQHMRKATSPSPPTVDVQDPNSGNGAGCFSASCCAALPAADKIRNAQNYALFALDVLAFPERAKPQSRACGRPVVRRQDVPSLPKFKVRAKSSTSTLPPTTTTTSTLLPTSIMTTSLPKFKVRANSSTSTLPPTTTTKSTLLPTSIMTTSLQPTASARARSTVANGGTIPVVPGMIVIGGIGGGFITMNGKTIPIAAGQTIIVTDSTQAASTTSEAQSTTSASTTFEAQSTTSAAPTCSSAPRSFSGTSDFSDKSINSNDPDFALFFAGLTFGEGPLDNDTSPTSTVTPSATAAPPPPPPPPPAPTATPITVMSLDESNISGGQIRCFPASIDVNLIAGGQTSFQYKFTLDSPVSKFTVGPDSSDGPFLFQAHGSTGSGSGNFTIGTGDTPFSVCVTNNGDNPAHFVLSIFYFKT
ncbi:hypothetical protein LY78DRAFT_633120 [Colletotrichum sublineola]|nr:hypothetical protein LY78DRAFT_633120 [Colletotrichum sublineola]